MIKAAYNFTPLEEVVYQPEWADLVSQDVPFRNSLSGRIDLKLTANTAIFVKDCNGRFVNVNEICFIPGTTIKGCIRSVLEIMSLGHLDDTRVQERFFAYRDMSRRSDYLRRMVGNIFCGWLKKNGATYQLQVCGKPVYISYAEIRRAFQVDVSRARHIFEKYERTHNTYLTGIFEFEKNNNGRKYYKVVSEESSASIRGTIVFSGAFSHKKSDFIFPDTDEPRLIEVEPVLKSKVDELFKNYKDELSLKYRDESIKEKDLPLNGDKGIPVFFTYEPGEAHEKVGTIGWLYLHKYFASRTIFSAIPDDLKSSKPDLADVIFGSVKYKLKGRVQFGAAFKTKGDYVNLEQGIEKILSSPKASFYPTYLQEGNTWESGNGYIAGRKRYPIKPVWDSSMVEPSNVSCTLFPLNADSEFMATLRFHNLKDIELGALLSAITFHGKENKCKHSMGQAKAYGFGSVSIQIDKFKLGNEAADWKNYLKCFADEMNRILPDWENSSSLKELFAMAEGIPESRIYDFSSMVLGGLQDEFRQAKNRGEYLKRYTEIISGESAMPQKTGKVVTNDRKASDFIQDISAQERKNGWEIELKEEYDAKLINAKKVCIYPPDRKRGNVICFYEVDTDFGKKSFSSEDKVVLEVLEKDENTVVVKIVRVKSKNKNYYK